MGLEVCSSDSLGCRALCRGPGRQGVCKQLPWRHRKSHMYIHISLSLSLSPSLSLSRVILVWESSGDHGILTADRVEGNLRNSVACLAHYPREVSQNWVSGFGACLSEGLQYVRVYLGVPLFMETTIQEDGTRALKHELQQQSLA